MRVFPILAAVAGAIACREKPEPAPARPAAASEGPSSSALAPKPPAIRPGALAHISSPAEARAKCEAAIAPDARPDLRVEGAVVGGHMTCNLYREKDLLASVTADCARGTSLEDFQNKLPKVKAERIPDLGRGGWRAKSLMGFTHFYDGQVECECKATAFKNGLDDLKLARAFESGLTVETAPKPPPPMPGEAKLNCDDLVPPALRGRLRLAKRVEQVANFGKVRCSYTGKGTLHVELDCRAVPKSPAERLEAQRKSQKALGRYQAEVDVGRGGFSEEDDKVTFVDPETECIVSSALVGTRRGKALEIAREVEKAVTPEAIGR